MIAFFRRSLLAPLNNFRFNHFIVIFVQVRDLESPLTVFAYRTHAHKHGTRISGYRVDAGDETREGKIVEIARGDPQKPQAFYPTTQPQVIHNGDWIAARLAGLTLTKLQL